MHDAHLDVEVDDVLRVHVLDGDEQLAQEEGGVTLRERVLAHEPLEELASRRAAERQGSRAPHERQLTAPRRAAGWDSLVLHLLRSQHLTVTDVLIQM